jgi:hypothetical protein
MDQRREPTRRRFTSRRGLEGELVDHTGVGGSGETSNMRSNIRYCKGHGWQVLAGADVPEGDLRACGICVVVER